MVLLLYHISLCPFFFPVLSPTKILDSALSCWWPETNHHGAPTLLSSSSSSSSSSSFFFFFFFFSLFSSVFAFYFVIMICTVLFETNGKKKCIKKSTGEEPILYA
jgi:hypothetical protein